MPRNALPGLDLGIIGNRVLCTRIAVAVGLIISAMRLSTSWEEAFWRGS